MFILAIGFTGQSAEAGSDASVFVTKFHVGIADQSIPVRDANGNLIRKLKKQDLPTPPVAIVEENKLGLLHVDQIGWLEKRFVTIELPKRSATCPIGGDDKTAGGSIGSGDNCK